MLQQKNPKKFVAFRLVHSSRNPESTGRVNCSANHYLWIGSGASLSSIKIRCPVCSSQKDLGEIYSSKLRCRGRRPENSGGDTEECDSEQAIVVQRGSFQLRLPEVITSLTIPPLVSPIHRTLQRDDLQSYISVLKDFGLNEQNFKRGLIRQVSEKRIPKQIADELTDTSWNEIEAAINAIESVSVPKTRIEYLQQEHQALTDVIDTGFPPYPTEGERRPGELVSFQVEPTAIRKDVFGPNRHMKFRIMPIERLRVIIVQVGYRRVEYVGPDSSLSSTRGKHPLNSEQFWVPGVEQFGEGVFIDLNPDYRNQASWYPQGKSAVEWDERIQPVTNPYDLITWNALSVWWHSFSHRLINAMSLHSGYSSSAIRERIYLSQDESGAPRGGVLLYTTQPGGDGTMGGLTSLVPQFDDIFKLALASVDRCSNDPLCEHAEIDTVSKLGAACYSCQMVSETSCEHFNGYLNRRILMENLP